MSLVEIEPGVFLKPCWTVEDWHGNMVVDRIFRSYQAAERAHLRFLRNPDADEDTRIVLDYTS